ncbi:iron-sulfur cluster assembly accessory protein [Candidatus Marinamargulisbacteria bacterium SCGC AG-410-N11]|nr:iron-sulfur cluster assembly accessory protein [Candidatus Marinamargulisbacteria bacterium SCGC AG-410-N11]
MSDCGNVQKVFVPSAKEKAAVKKQSISSVEITDYAAEKIKHFIQKDGKSVDDYGLKIQVVNDGCSGKSYTMDLSDIKSAQDNGDKVFSKNGAYIIIEKLSYLFVLGSRLDYTESLLASGFQLTNPNVKKSCSCGSSFAV